MFFYDHLFKLGVSKSCFWRATILEPNKVFKIITNFKTTVLGQVGAILNRTLALQEQDWIPCFKESEVNQTSLSN